MKFSFPTRPSRGQTFFAVCAFGLAALVCAGCHTKPDLPKDIPEFYLEAPNQAGIAFTLPISQLTYRRMADSFLDLSQITGVEQGHVTVTLPDGATEQKPVVFFFFNDDGRERLNMVTGSSPQRRIFLFVNQKPMGVRFIDQPIDSGQLYMFLEVPDKELADYVKDLKASVKRAKDMKNGQ